MSVNEGKIGGGGVFQVISTSGHKQTGAADLDNVIIDNLVNEFRSQHGVGHRNDKMAMARLKDAAERAKIELSNLFSTEANLPFISSNANGPKHLQITLTRSKLEQLTFTIDEKIRDPIMKVHADVRRSYDTTDRAEYYYSHKKESDIQYSCRNANHNYIAIAMLMKQNIEA